ncbi:hypothetical protein CAI21_01525 [Alkalilimnicola ehrlichii]|uniref:Gp5/Type VI secretion system Vgr protein OB-fold domain-containing protein n=1 Tax=Alkalilimnicola ehrlichii TaxID=351052 RepID=A0A3E0X1A7_9GAMM|nr:phage baseplate assembly protein V [Alkalilimnicola ehrlichii]RFA31335.1 hypothetical protein CAI21_01525 [Alkalilimnicola ehrlichii]RFA39391.1 hypothetical protein CAL65_00885 [Alkalilimnicola ehrlichii]
MNNVAELLRLLNNLVRLGTVHEVDTATARARIKSGAILTGWLPWLSARAGTTRDWDPPTAGEQVLLLSPGGDLSQAIVLTGIYSEASPPPATDPSVWKREFPDGTTVTYDHAEKALAIATVDRIEIQAGGDITIEAAGNLVLKGNRVELNP